MASLIGALRVSLSADTAAFQRGLSKAESQARKSSSNITKSLGGVRSAVSGLLAGISLASMAAVAQKALDYASSLGEVAQQLGVTTKALQEYRYAASQAGISQDEMDKALAKLTQTMGKAKTGAEGPKKVFSELSRILGKDILASATDAGDAIPLIADALAKIQDPAKRAAIEVALFGKAGQKLDTLLAGGGDAVNSLRDAAQSLGIVLSDEQIQRADDTADKLSKLKQVLEANIAGAVANNAEAILALADAFAKLIVNIGGAIQQFSIWSNIQGFRNGDYGSTRNLLSTRSGRDAALNDLNARMQQNVSDRAKNRGTRKSYLGGLIEVTDGATQAENDRLDREYQGMVQMRNRILELDRKLGADRPNPPTGPSASPDINLSPGGGRKDNSAAEAERARKDALRDQHQHDMDIARAQMDELRAREDLAVETQDKASLAIQQLELEREIERKQVKFDLAMGDITAKQAEEMDLQADTVTSLRRRLITMQGVDDAMKERLRLEQEASAIVLEGLELQRANARTAAQRRAIEQQILSERLRIERLQLKDVLDSDTATANEKQTAERRMLFLDRREGAMRNQVDRDNMGPLQSFFDTLPRTAAEANEALEEVAAGGIQSMVDGLAEAAIGARSLGGVFKNVAKEIIADLIRIQIRKAIVGALGNVLGGLGGGIGSGLPSAGALIDNVGKQFAPTSLPGFARGGSFMVGGNPGVDTNLLSINGQPRARVSASERIAVIPNNADGGRRSSISFDLRGAVMTSDLLKQMSEIATATGGMATIGGGRLGQAAVNKQFRRRIPG